MTAAEHELATWQSIPRAPGPWWTHPDEPTGLWWGDQAILLTHDQYPQDYDEDAFGRDYGPVSGGNLDRPEDAAAIVTAVNNYGPALQRIVELERVLDASPSTRGPLHRHSESR